MKPSTPLAIDSSLLKAAADRVARRCDTMARHSETSNFLTRTFCSDAMKSAHAELKTWMEATGMKCRLDAVGNLIGEFHSIQPASTHDGPRDVFMIGSHMDTVVNAGQFDGTMGALLGLGVVEVLTEAQAELPFDIDVVAFSEEEGVRFGFPFIGSLGIAGHFDPGDFDRLDQDGVSMRDALKQFGCNPNELQLASYCSEANGRNLIGFMEAHLEQSTRLERNGAPVGVVSAIAGQTRASIVLAGTAGHAGTVLHDQRKDALAAAAKLILDIEELGQTTDGLFATIGSISASPGLSNVICSDVNLRLDLRHESDAVREQAFKTIDLMIRELKRTRGIAGRIHDTHHSPAVPMDAVLSQCLDDAIGESGAVSERLVSGAGHDTMIMAEAAPSCMLFLRCRDGISHHPDEFVAPEDIYEALKVMTQATIKIAQTHSQQSSAAASTSAT